MYRLMKTAGFDFLNVPPTIAGQITAFNSIDDIIRARKENGERNSGNNATCIEKMLLMNMKYMVKLTVQTNMIQV